MENLVFGVVSISSLILLLSYVIGRIGYYVWVKPKIIEKHLKQQGIGGTPYKLLFGDLKENVRLMKEAWSKPMNLNHNIVPRVIPLVHETVQKYGKTSLFWLGTTPRVIILDPELMKEVLSDKFNHFPKPPLNPSIKLLGFGVSGLEGEEWAKRRKLINPAFHIEKLKRMVPSFSTSCSELIKRWEDVVGPQGSCELDVWPELQNLTRDAISRTSFGSSYKEGKRIFQLQTEQVELVLEAALSVYVPGFRYIPTKKNKRRMYLDKEIKSMLRDLIHRKERAIKAGESSDDDLLSLLLLSNNNNDVPEDEHSSKKNGLTIDDVIEECKLFYFAGQETTSVLLTWTMIILSMHPSWQEKAREEVLQICGKSKLNFESISHLKIVNMILYEVLRLYPSVTGLFRHTYKKTKLGDISLPAGVDLYLPTLSIHHDPEYWGEDVDEFKPERFSEGFSKASNDQVAFFPFGWGPRICIGQNFAMIEAKVALAMILQRFSFELSPSYIHAPFMVITLQPQHGAQIILHKL